MSHRKRAGAARDHHHFISRLSLERCRRYVCHMQAVLHVCDETGEEVAGALRQIMDVLDLELRYQLELTG